MDATCTPVRLLLVSRHTLTRAALARLIADRQSLELVGETGSRLQAVTKASEEAPDVILLEPQPGSDLWLDAVGPLRVAGKHAKVLLLTALRDPDLLRQSLEHGARGIVHFDQHPESLFRAIECVHEGELWMERKLIAEVITAPAGGGAGSRIGALTQRERQVVRLVSEGLKNKQIAERLSIADVTVRHHLTSIFIKLDVADRLSLVVFAFRNGLALTDLGPKRASTVQSQQSPLR
jgi:DNA-binding NarL/FixJ family response regulator